MGLTTEQLFSTRPKAGTNTTQAATPASSSSSAASLFGLNGIGSTTKKSTATANQQENKNSTLGIIGRGVTQLLPSIGKGVTSAIDSIADAPSSIGNAIAQSSAKKDPTSLEKKFNARRAEQSYKKASSQHVLGDTVRRWEENVDKAQAQIVEDNPTSKVASTTAKALELGEAIGEMAPSIAASVATGGIGGAAIGGTSAAAAAAARGVTGAAKAINRVGKLSQAAGLGTMFANVYDKSFDNAVAQGNDYTVSGKKAFGDAALEVGTELLFGGIAGLGQGVVSTAAKKAASKSLSAAAASEGAEKLIKLQGVKDAGVNLAKLVVRASEAAEQSTGLRKLLINGLGEGAEEMISEFFGPYIERATTNPNASNATIGEMLEAGLGGALISFAMAPLGRLHARTTTTSADVQERAKLQYILSDTKQQVALMRNLVNDSATGETQVRATEQLLGTELARKDFGVETGLWTGTGILQQARRNLANQIITEAEQKNTADAMSEAWGKLRELYEQESQYRMDAAAHTKLENSLADKAAAKDDAVVKAQERLDAAQATLDAATAGKAGAAETAKAKAAVEAAQTALNEAMKKAKKRLEKNLRRADAVDKYGEETVDAFTASARYKAAKDGAVITAEDGTQSVMTREQYAQRQYGKSYEKATAEERAEIDRVFKAYQDSIRREQNAFVKKLNEQAAALNNGIKIKFDDEAGGMTAGFNASYRADSSTIVFSREAVQTEGAANYYLSHELLHNLSAKFMTQEQRSAFYANLRTMMEDVGVNYDSMFRAVAAVYDRAYSRQAAKAADRKNLKGTPRKRYIEAYLYDKFTEETYARFMQTAFGSESILQTLAQQDYTLVEQMRESVQYSSLKALYGSEWDYARLSALDKINRALASPTDAETNREKNAEAIDSGMAELYSLDMTTEKEETRDGSYADNDRKGEAGASGKSDAGGAGGRKEKDGGGASPLGGDDAGGEEGGYRGSRSEGTSVGNLPVSAPALGAPAADAQTILRNNRFARGKLFRTLRDNADAPAHLKPYMEMLDAVKDYHEARRTAQGFNARRAKQDRGNLHIVIGELYDNGERILGLRDYASGDVYVALAPNELGGFYAAGNILVHETFHKLVSANWDVLDGLWENAVAQGLYAKKELYDKIHDSWLAHYQKRFDESNNLVFNEFFAHLIAGQLDGGWYVNDYEDIAKLQLIRSSTLEWLQDYADKNGLAVDFRSLKNLSIADAISTTADEVAELARPVQDWWARKLGVARDDISVFPYALSDDSKLAVREPLSFSVSATERLDDGEQVLGDDLATYHFTVTPTGYEYVEELNPDASYSSDLAAGYSDMTEERLRQYDELRRKYGEYEGGAPKRTNDHTAVSKTAADIIGSEDTPEAFADVLRSRLLDGAFSHIVMTDANAKSSARELLSSFSTLGEAYNAAVNTMFNNQHLVNKNDIAFGEQLIVDMAERIRSIEDGTTMPNESTDPTELFDQLQHLIAQVCSAGTRAGQNLQAFSLLKKMTPTGRLYYINSQIEAFVSEMTDRYGQSRVGGFKFKKGPDGTYIKDINGHYVPLRVDPEIQEELLSCTTKEELDAAEEKALENLASKIPPSLEDRVVAWRYLAMLGNPRTHIRNIVSNYAMGAAVGVKDRIAGAFEDTFLKDKTEGRTKTNRSLSKEERTAMDDFIKQDWEGGVRDQTLTGGKVGFESRLNDKRRKLDGSLDKLAKKNTELLELEDETAALRAYRRAFSNYAAANGLSVDYLASNTMESNVALAQARRYASLEAQKATYRDASTIATLLNQLERKNAVSKIIVGGLVPFKKTPINILSRGVSYSPIGLVKGAVKWRRAATSTNSIVIIDADGKTRTLNRDGYAKEKYGKGYKDLDTKQRAEVDERFLLDHWDGSFSPTDNVDALNLERADDRRTARAKQTLAVANAIDELASGLTGTGILLLGVLLSHLGMLKGAGSDDDTEEYYDQMLGNQEYSVTIGGKNITLDWLTPISMPLFAGAAINEVAEDELEFSEIAESIARIADPVTNLSVLQGINDAMSSYDSDIGKFAASAAGGWVSQFIPTALGQVARSLDETRRTTYAPKDAEGSKQFATFVNKLENKIPGLSQQNAAYVDQWGRHETNSGDSFIERLINNSVVPWYSRDVNRTAADDYLTALRDETGSTDVLPDSPKSYYTFGNETFYLASDEYQTTKELVGQISSMGVNSLMAVPGFSQLSADDQAELVSDVYSFAKNFARADYAAAKGIDYEMSSSTAKIRDAVAAGMSLGTALYVQHVASGITADKDASGKTIRNSRKNKLYSFYTSLGLTRDQINAIAPYEYD